MSSVRVIFWSVANVEACACHILRKVWIFVNIVFSERELKFMFAICHRRSVCRLSVVCNVGAPYSGD